MQRAFADLKKNFYLCTTIIRERSASDRNYRDGAIAQLVEQRTENASVKHLKQTYKTLNTRWLQKCDHLFLSLEIGRKYTGLHNLCKPNV